MADLTGKVLGERYRVDTFLGRGGMADVYKVWDQQRAVFLAMKVLHADLAEDEVFLRRFEREAQTLARLQHPNIVRFYGLEQTPTPDNDASAAAQPFAFILMDFIDGLTLRKEIHFNKPGMTPLRILEVMRPVCAALYYAHQMGMIHCDIKPSNIMLHRNGAAYLTDFGISRMTEASGQAAGGMGTPAYMAPEQLHGLKPTPASDIYSLGVVLFEMVTGGRRPYTGEAATGGLTDDVTGKITWEKDHLPAPSPRKYAPSLSPELETIIQRCLERRPERRYQTVLELLEALETACGEGDLDDLLTPTGKETAAAPGLPGGPRPAAASRRTWRIRLVTLAAAMLLAVGGLTLLTRSAQAPTFPFAGQAAAGMTAAGGLSGGQAKNTAVGRKYATPTPTATITTTPVRPAGNALARPTLTGGSGQIAYAFDAGEGVIQVWVMQADQPEKHRVVTHEPGGACQPTWSPDGQSLAYTTPCSGPSVYYPSATIKVIHLKDNTVERLPLTGGGISAAFDPAWSPDGQTLAYTVIVGKLIQINAYSFQTGQVATLAAKGIRNSQPAWSPDGQHIAYITTDAQQLHPDALWLMGRNGDSQEVVSNARPYAAPVWSPDGSKILVSIRNASNTLTLALIDRANPDQGAQPLLDQDKPVQGGSFSPDGQWIAYWSGLAIDREIYIARLDGKIVRRLTTNKMQDFQPAWSPR